MPGAVIYELHVGTFTPEGTLDAAIGRLDHLVDLGVTVVELMPVAAFPGDHGWGYDGIGLWAVHEPYGGPDALKRFVDACHARGLAVYLDVVYNHVGPGNRLASFGPYFTDAHLTPWGPAVNLDQPGSDEVRAFIVDNALMWLRDYHLDGLRLDAVHALVDTRALHILEELAVAVDALAAAAGRSIVLVAESDLNNPRLITARQAGGYGLDAQWNDDFHHAVHALVTGERQGYYSDFGSLAGVAKTLTRAYFHDGTWSAFRGRTHGRPVDTRQTPAYRFVVFDQDHDQVGNRAVGDRLTATLARPPEPARAAPRSCPACCSPRRARRCCSWARSGAPTRRGSSSPTTPIPGWRRRSAPAAGRSSLITAGDRPTSPTRRTRRRSSAPSSTGTSPPASRTGRCSAWYRALLALRRSRPELADPRFDRVHVDYDEDARWLLIRRGELRIAANLGEAEAILPLGEPAANPVALLTSAPGISIAPDAVTMPPATFAIIDLSPGPS